MNGEKVLKIRQYIYFIGKYGQILQNFPGFHPDTNNIYLYTLKTLQP